MEKLFPQIRIGVHEKIFIKDPESTELGKRIVQKGVELIEAVGLEQFNFKKLATALGVSESSIYRYFENKYMFLLYISAWYWTWMETFLVFATSHLHASEEKIFKVVQILCQEDWSTVHSPQFSVGRMRRILVAESSKAFLRKEIDAMNAEGIFSGFKQLTGRISELFIQVKPKYPYPDMLASMLIEAIFHQQFLLAHFPSLDNTRGESDKLVRFFTHMVTSTLKESIDATSN
jgi:AcrR family transcriptional regulator